MMTVVNLERAELVCVGRSESKMERPATGLTFVSVIVFSSGNHITYENEITECVKLACEKSDSLYICCYGILLQRMNERSAIHC